MEEFTNSFETDIAIAKKLAMKLPVAKHIPAKMGSQAENEAGEATLKKTVDVKSEFFKAKSMVENAGLTKELEKTPATVKEKVESTAKSPSLKTKMPPQLPTKPSLQSTLKSLQKSMEATLESEDSSVEPVKKESRKVHSTLSEPEDAKTDLKNRRSLFRKETVVSLNVSEAKAPRSLAVEKEKHVSVQLRTKDKSDFVTIKLPNLGNYTSEFLALNPQEPLKFDLNPAAPLPGREKYHSKYRDIETDKGTYKHPEGFCSNCEKLKPRFFSKYKFPGRPLKEDDFLMPAEEYYRLKQSSPFNCCVHDSKYVKEKSNNKVKIDPGTSHNIHSLPWDKAEYHLNIARSRTPYEYVELSDEDDDHYGYDRRMTRGNNYYEKGKWHKEYKSLEERLQARRLYEEQVLPKKPYSEDLEEYKGLKNPRKYKNRTGFRGVSDMAAYYSNLAPSDQSEVINLLLSCRRLEKEIEAQHNIIEMLDNDLRQTQNAFKDQPQWGQELELDSNVPQFGDLSSAPSKKYPFYTKGQMLFESEEKSKSFY